MNNSKLIPGVLLICFVVSCKMDSSRTHCTKTVFDEGNYILLKNASLFDAPGADVLENHSVLIKDDLIYDLGPDESICIPKSVNEFDIEDRLLSPGLIESHGHQTFNEPWDTTKIKLEKLLRAGITGIRNMAGRVPSYNDWSQKIETDQAIGPEIYSSAFFAGQEFFNVDSRLQKYRDFGADPGREDWMKMVDVDLDIPEALAKAKKSGAHGIKLYASLQEDWIKDIVSEARKNDLKVWSHAHLQYTETADIIEAGVNSISHAEMLSHTIGKSGAVVKDLSDIDSLRIGNIFDKMIEKETYFDVTLELYYRYSGEDSERSKFATKLVNLAVSKGVLIVAGSDSEGFWEDGKVALYDEIVRLVLDGGMTKELALQSATYNPARLLGIDKDYGTIAKGKKSNLVVFGSNPLDDIQNIRNIHLTIKEGIVYK